MSNTIELTETVIAKKLFDFVEENFDLFECEGKSNKWWYSQSWSPFVETCFILCGKELVKQNKISDIGHSFTHPNITEFMKNFRDDPYDRRTKYPNRCFDVSWHNKSRLILALEHEETTKGEHKGKSSTVRNNLEEIYKEIDKLIFYPAEFKIIVSRPRLRQISETYPQAIEYYREEIEKKLLSVDPIVDEKWIVILI